LVDLIKVPIQASLCADGVTQVSEYEIIRCTFGKVGPLQVNAAYPHSLELERLNNMVADEATSTAN
jgi:hypothetical protein